MAGPTMLRPSHFVSGCPKTACPPFSFERLRVDFLVSCEGNRAQIGPEAVCERSSVIRAKVGIHSPLSRAFGPTV